MLGSGLGALAERLDDRVEVPYGELPGFRAGGLAGHAGMLVLGRLAGQPVAIFAGRSHVYEGIEAGAITTPIRTLKALGAELLVLTNAAGSLRAEAAPGQPGLHLRPHQPARLQPAHGTERRGGRPALPEPARRLRPGAARPPARRRGHARHPVARRRLPRHRGPELRDAGRDPRVPHARGRPRRHVHRPRGDRRPPCRAARRGRLRRHQPGRGHGRGGALARADAARGGRSAPSGSGPCWNASWRTCRDRPRRARPPRPAADRPHQPDRAGGRGADLRALPPGAHAGGRRRGRLRLSPLGGARRARARRHAGRRRGRGELPCG